MNVPKNFFLSGLLFFATLTFWAQSNASDLIKNAVEKDSERLIEMYKDIHQNPELGFMETRTAGIIAKDLKSLGYEVKTGIGVTGVVGIMKNGDGPTVMYRADMDCNAVKETTGLPYASTKVVKREDGSETPVMHACGHDAHVTWMLGVAKFMAEHKDTWKGTLVFVGQPAEEPIMGAVAMVDDGMYSKYGVPEPDALIGMHTAPIAVGMIACATGVRMAGTDQIDVTFHGIGGHGSMPNMTKDPVVMAAAAIMQYQIIVSRAIAPQDAAVLTVGSVQAGSDNNVIPASALVKINLRFFNERDRQMMINGIKRVNEGIAYAYDLPKDLYPTMKMKGHAEPLDNSKALTQRIQKATGKLLGEKNVLKEDVFPSVMGSEDFHHLVLQNEKVNYSYFQVGVADPDRFAQALKEGKSFPYSNHNGDFIVELSSIPLGTKIGITALLASFENE
ncbi:amidohydrolase [Aequorivita todarodis]|uniref:amidohydrolase n=1 Tax=Aequorivita todarodis TaxID=2036821 RepID=UPI00235046E2|nr:amidohydrolase [Aequorivita todarodis]MDC8001183.1 amidohydrolase [Aequorivita todarodis]